MSDKKNQDQTPSETDDILARNVGQLLRHSHEPPRIDKAASARILSSLEKRMLKEEAQPTGKSNADNTDNTDNTNKPSLLARLFGSPIRAGLIAATVAGAVVAAGVVLNRDADRQVAAVFVPEEFVNEEVAPKAIELADGTSLILRTGASLVTTGPRSIELHAGDVVFDVSKGDGEFIVTRPASDQRVVVLGTRFVLEADDTTLSAAVMRGSVRLEAAGAEIVLGAGEGGQAAAGAAPVRRPIPRLSHLVAWSKGARKRAEGTDVKPARRGNLIARFAGWDSRDYPLPIRDFGIDIHLENQIARVAIDQTFFNEHPSQLEGMYSFSLPAGAAISRLAMYVDGKLMEGGIAERAHARRVYESIVYRRRDPALMEWMAGNEVKVRIFPLFGRQEKRILLSYTQSLERLYDDVQLSVPLPRLERPVGVLRLRAKLVGCAECEVVSTSHSIETQADGDDLIVSFTKKKVSIDDDLLLSIRQPSSGTLGSVVATRDGDDHLVMARVTPQREAEQRASSKPRRWVLLHDTSGSRQGLDRQAQVHVIDRLLSELDETDEVAVVAFDATVRTMNDGAFSSVGNADHKATHDFVTAQGKAGVGYTDLGKGLERALELLASADRAADFEPMILYVGDGIATGGLRKPGELVRLIDGKATVVAVAVGATHDTAVLSALAGETGGLTATLNPGQDLSWRVFDLVASLHGERITGLRAEIEGSEAPVYASVRQLAAGEEVSLVTRVGAELPASIRLRGLRGGQPWSMDVPITAADVAQSGSEYLPRLWARKRIEALLAEEGLGKSVSHRSEIVALALKHWLLTPYTSLLVLENEAAYKQYKVARSSMTGWASYQVPKKIKVVTEPLTAGIDLAAANIGALVIRSPSPLFTIQSAPQYYDWNGDGLGFRSSLRGDLSGNSWGSMGLGLRGVGGGGAGRSGWVPAEGRLSRFSARQQPRATAADETSRNKNFDFTKSEQEDAPSNEIIDTRSGRFGGTKSLENNHIVTRGHGKSGAYKGRGPMPAGRTFQYALGNAHLSQPLAAAGLTYPHDGRFNDVTSLVPAMFTTSLDRERERLVRDARRNKAVTHAIDDDAAAMIAHARKLAGLRYRGEAGEVIDIDRQGRFRIERTTLTGLRETLTYDGEQAVADYPELDIAVSRQVGPAEPILFEQETPMLLAKAEHLARFYAISKESSNSIALTPPKAKWRLLVRFTGDGRLAGMEHQRGSIADSQLSIRYETNAVVVARGDSEVRYAIEDSGDLVGETSARSATINLPLRHPAFLEAKLKGGVDRAVQQQLAASYVALGQFHKVGEVALAMAKDAPLSDGELTLLSGGIIGLAKNASKALSGSDAKSLVGRYVASSATYRTQNKAAGLRSLGKEAGWVASLSLLRAAQVRTTSGRDAAGAKKVLDELIARAEYPAFAYLGVFSFDQYARWRSPKLVASAWEAMIARGGEWAAPSRVRLASALTNAARYEDAAKQWVVIRDTALAHGQFPPLDYQVTNAFRNGARGDAGWRTFWRTTRDSVLASGTLSQKLGLLQAARSLGHADDLARIVNALPLTGPSKMSDAQRIAVVKLLASSSKPGLAQRVFEPLRKTVADGKVHDTAILKLASQFAANRGETLEAARILRRALVGDDADVTLAVFRRDHTNLLRLYSSAAQIADTAGQKEIVAEMLTVSEAWRAHDPDNASHDAQLSNALFSVGATDEAMRVLSTAIERRPMEGRSFETVAVGLEGQGNVSAAIGFWERAVTVEPENPTWSLRLARAHAANGEADKARTVLDSVLARKDWHERFQWIVSQAKQTRAQL